MNDAKDTTPALTVGIGASAGGIEALKAFFKAMPSDSDMAFVLIQHLEPDHASHMAEILGRCTSMPVVQAEDGMWVCRNHVYANPAGKYLSIEKGMLVLADRSEQDRVRMPIDYFLTSLAVDRQERAACIILSGGSGADGTRGVRAVRGAGGMCIAQSPETAQSPAMPQSAIDSGLIDQVLSVAQMPAALVGYARNALKRTRNCGAIVTGASTDALESILKLLRVRANSDYRHYKKTTIVRRIHRRMGITQAASMGSYSKLLQDDPAELTQLSTDMLIGVSSFFRDREAFDDLWKQVVVPLVANKDPNCPLRAWVPGCATGEEAYSIAMLLLEAVAATDTTRHVQVFASDVDERALSVGRAGFYAENVVETVPADRLGRFFTRQGDKYQVTKQLREAVVFSRQDLISDPPFAKLDLVSCRNVLIYIEPIVQKKILSLFSFALNTPGYLFLGKSEGIAGLEELFEPICKQRRIYGSTRPVGRPITAFPLSAGGRRVTTPEIRPAPQTAAVLALTNQAALLRHFQASIVLVNPQGQILHFFGETERYLSHPKGLASLNVLDLAAGRLSVTLRRALDRALRQDDPVVIPSTPVARAGNMLAKLTVFRVPPLPATDQLLAIIFEDANEPRPRTSTAQAQAADESLVTQLEEEVKALRDELRANTGDFDAATEALRAANEEVMSMNEELQSANEELEASKEELQSLNEELTTVNSQLGERLAELTAANNDLTNLFTATEIATVFLDSQLRIKRFTTPATKLLNLIPTDLGRPIAHITQNFDGQELAAESQETLRRLAPTEKEVQTYDDRWHTMRILPYRTLDNRIDGVVITFADVTRLKAIEQERRELERRMQHAQKLQSLGVLAGGIAHDFNNILTAVLGYLDLASLELEDDAQVTAYIANARDCTLRASTLTAQMLAYSGKSANCLRSESLNGIIGNMRALLAASIARTVTVDYRLADALPPINADASQLGQVILNLMVNAAEAIGDSSGTITVTTSVIHDNLPQLAQSFPNSDLPEGDYAMLEVRDTGCGMDRATTAQVFEPFFTTKFTGRGLGLAAVIGIIQCHRGAIAVDSTPGIGSVFRVILPVDTSRDAIREPLAEVMSVPVVDGGTILVIDDEPNVLNVATAFLERSGFTVLVAADGAEGIDTFRMHATGIDAVLLDVTMPGLNTETVMEELRAVRPDIAILLCSGYSEQGIGDRFTGKGMSGFVAKPFTRNSLASAVAECLAKIQ